MSARKRRPEPDPARAYRGLKRTMDSLFARATDDHPVKDDAEAEWAWFLRPEVWRSTRRSCLDFWRLAAREAAVARGRRRNFDTLLGHVDPRSSRALTRQFPLGQATTKLVKTLLLRHRDHYRARGEPEPKSWSASFDHRDLTAISNAMNLVREYSCGEDPFGLFDDESARLGVAFERILAAIDGARSVVEDLIRTIRAADRMPLAAYRGRIMLDAARTAVFAWQPPKIYARPGADLVRIAETLERVKPKIPRRMIASWVREIGLADVTERSWTTRLHRLRRAGKAHVQLRKKHSVHVL